MDSVIIIPTHNPGRELVSYVEELISACVPHVLVVNDGSDAEYSQIFEEISMLPGVTLLSQAVKDRESAMALAIDYYEPETMVHRSYENPVDLKKGSQIVRNHCEPANRFTVFSYFQHNSLAIRRYTSYI